MPRTTYIRLAAPITSAAQAVSVLIRSIPSHPITSHPPYLPSHIQAKPANGIFRHPHTHTHTHERVFESE